ncbi:MAG: MFS transporter [Clostridiales bacterium]|nr:MFS transporter [Clostridiales bacterium]
MNRKTLLIKYCTLQGLFWAICCVSSGSINTYLYEIGVGTGTIGLLSGLAGITATLIQPVLGGIADRNPAKRGWRFMLQAFSVLLLASYIILKLTSNHMISGILMALTFMSVYAMFPFINGITFYYEREGIVLDYGTSRGIGSICSAGTSYLIGAGVTAFGVSVITTTGIILTMLFVGITFTFPVLKSDVAKTDVSEENSSPAEASGETIETAQKTESTIAFFRQYPEFAAILFGFICVFCCQMLGSGYNLQICERLGGGTTEMGIVQAIASMVELPIMFSFSAIIKRVPSYKLLKIASVAFLLKALCLLMANSIYIVYAAQLIQMFSYGLFTMAAVYYANEIVTGSNKLKGQALLGSATSIGGPAGNFLGGMLIQYFGLTFDLAVAVVLGIIGVTSVFMAGKLKKKHA